MSGQQIPKIKFLQIRSRLPRTHFSGDGLRRIFFRSLGAAIFHEPDPSATEPCKCKRIIARRLYSLFGPNLSGIDPLSSVVAVVITLGHKGPRDEMLIILSLSLLDGAALASKMTENSWQLDFLTGSQPHHRAPERRCLRILMNIFFAIFIAFLDFS